MSEMCKYEFMGVYCIMYTAQYSSRKSLSSTRSGQRLFPDNQISKAYLGPVDSPNPYIPHANNEDYTPMYDCTNPQSSHQNHYKTTVKCTIMFLMDFIKIFIVVQIGRLAVLILFQRRFYKRQKNANCEVIDYRLTAVQHQGRIH